MASTFLGGEIDVIAWREALLTTVGPGAFLSPHAYFPDPEVLITWGPYNYVRNPMAKALFTVLCGWGLFLISPMVLLFALAMGLFLHLLVVFVEEPKLERRFGDSYREYKRRVNRWLPSRRLFAG
jgi:protein-S-isoprenylcysteine O-methyltransferase Ste14